MTEVGAMLVMRSVVAAVTVTVLAALGAGCGGLSAGDAQTRCDQDQAALGYFFDDAVMAACVACFEDCGDSCVRHATTPLTYSCSTDTSTGGAASK
jgi:cytochrome c553